ncbi:MAG: hypothetical protein COV72_01885 [Candidatus Omnitrophica bacterium CG11_big_fil_rev_8_21_14_0_20_42_13]|uniref:phosphoglycolate phosphatase n=1 Tax=Candidatus Ghiorseimicrobium undicola TaxID=1974746 RepID=A0A2H0LZ34_9BACT|nr:MAG: hypothetical protein COV72_01885 [Candidatus Omnitrophica bacterium CG11_big_fil_rev_8_21_14_0_20_42_13]
MIDVDLLVFDLDGTLVDSKKGIVKAVKFTLRKLGLDERLPGEIASYIGTGVESLIRQSIGEKNKTLLIDGVSIFERHYKKHFAQRDRLYPNVKSTLKHFRNKLMFVATNRKKEMARLTLNSLGIGGYFKDVIGGDDELCVKPSVCPLKKVLRTNRNRKRCMIVGDMDLDIISGKNAGILTCAVTYGIGEKKDILRAGPDYLINNIAGLKKIIR